MIRLDALGGMDGIGICQCSQKDVDFSLKLRNLVMQEFSYPECLKQFDNLVSAATAVSQAAAGPP